MAKKFEQYTLSDLIRDLTEMAEEHGSDLPILVDDYSHYVDQRQLFDHERFSVEAREVTEDEVRHTTETNVKAGKAVVLYVG